MKFLFLLLYVFNQNVFSAKPREALSVKPQKKTSKTTGDSDANPVRLNQVGKSSGQAVPARRIEEPSLIMAKGKSSKKEDDSLDYEPSAADKKLANEIAGRIKNNQKAIAKVAGDSVKSLQKNNRALTESRDYFQRRNAISPSEADEIIKFAKDLQLKKSSALSRSKTKTPARVSKAR